MRVVVATAECCDASGAENFKLVERCFQCYLSVSIRD